VHQGTRAPEHQDTRCRMQDASKDKHRYVQINTDIYRDEHRYKMQDTGLQEAGGKMQDTRGRMQDARRKIQDTGYIKD